MWARENADHDGTGWSIQRIVGRLHLENEFASSPGKSKLVDYTVPVGGRDFLFEVKQFEQKNLPPLQLPQRLGCECRSLRT